MTEMTKEQERQFVGKWQLFGRLKVWKRHPVLCKEPFDDEKIKAMIASGELSYDTYGKLARYRAQERLVNF